MRQICLDDTQENNPPSDFVVAASEVEFLRYDGAAAKLWVRGGNLCNWVRAVYRVRHHPQSVTLTTLESPRQQLRHLLGSVVDTLAPHTWQRVADISAQQQITALNQLLFRLTGQDFWLAKPTPLTAAHWLVAELPSDCETLAQAQLQLWQQETQSTPVAQVYAAGYAGREAMLHQWLFDESCRAALGEFPLVLPEALAKSVRDELGRQLRATNGATVRTWPRETPNQQLYARVARAYFEHNPTHLTKDYLVQLNWLLSAEERTALTELLPPPVIAPLAAEADYQTALRWATQEYLPERKRQAQAQKFAANDLAASFVAWLLNHYPQLTSSDRQNSPLNLRTFQIVKQLAEKYWVLWVVVDGLNYLNHQFLLKRLGEQSAGLRLIQDDAVFAVLPTITEKAKYGLTSGQFPAENLAHEWKMSKVFQTGFPSGVFAGTDAISALSKGLKCAVPTVCYWNFLSVDECFHKQKEFVWAQSEAENELRGLARTINQLVLQAHDPDRVAVVICSDHGQMLEPCQRFEFENTHKYHAHGRTMLGDLAGTHDPNQSFIRNADGTTILLNPKSFRLSEPTTVAAGTQYFVDWGGAAATGNIGVHGGLFPEEVVLGLSVLLRQPVRPPLTAQISGTGTSGQAGQLTLRLDNPHPVAVKLLSLSLTGIELDLTNLELLELAAQKTVDCAIAVARFPTTPQTTELAVTGALRYAFANGTQETCEVTGSVTCQTLYATRNPNLRDRFKR